MPSSAQAAIVLLIVILPGFLAQGGYRLGRASREHQQGLVVIGRLIALSTVIALVAWKLGGHRVFDDTQAGVALTKQEARTYRFAVFLLLLPPSAGFVVGQLIDVASRRLANIVDRHRGSEATRRSRRAWRTVCRIASSRLLQEGPTAWDRTWTRIRRTEGLVCAQVTTTGGRVIVGLVGDQSRVALSPQPRDLYSEQTLRAGPDGRLHRTRFGLGAFVSGADIESVEWLSQKAIWEVPDA